MSTRSSPARRNLRAWLDPRGRHLSGWTFIANRLSAVLLVGYLYLHLGVLSLLIGGSAGWDRVVSLFRTPWFLGLEGILLVLIVFHAVNGVRVALIGTGLLLSHRSALVWALVSVGALLALLAVVLLGIMG